MLLVGCARSVPLEFSASWDMVKARCNSANVAADSIGVRDTVDDGAVRLCAGRFSCIARCCCFGKSFIVHDSPGQGIFLGGTGKISLLFGADDFFLVGTSIIARPALVGAPSFCGCVVFRFVGAMVIDALSLKCSTVLMAATGITQFAAVV